MSTTIRIKKSGITSNTPGTLEFGELAINYADGKLFYKDATGNIQQFSSGGNINAFETVNANGSLLIADSNTDILNIIAGTGIDISGNTVSDTFTITSRLDNTFTSTSTTSAATPAAVNAVHTIAASAYSQANAAYTQANAAYVQANAAYTKANAPITIKEIYSSNGNVINSFANINTIQFDTESGLAVVDESNNAVTIQLNSTFKYWNINGAPGLVATGLDTVNFIGSGITITANNNASPKTITFTSTGGGGGGSNTEIIVDSNTVVAQTNTFTLSQNVNAISQLVVAKNGLQLTPNLHFIVSGNTVTLNAVAEINDVMTFTNFRSVTGTSSGAGLTQYSYNTTTSSIETVDEWSKSTYRSAKYQMQVESGAGYYSTDIMLIHDGVSTNLVQYGTVSFASNVGVFSSDISGSNVRLRFTATDATSNLTYFRTILANRASESLPSDLMNGSDSYDLMITLPFNPTDLN